MSEEDFNTLVIDNGSCMMKAGFAGEHAPRAVFPTIVRRLGDAPCMIHRSQRECYVGNEAITNNDMFTEWYSYKYPIEHGVITDWDNMDRVWGHTFYKELRAAPEEFGLLLTEQPLNPMVNREKTTEIMFEAYNFQLFHMCICPVLSLYASGRTTGLVVESGAGVSHVVPIFKQQALTHAMQRQEIGSGRDLTDYLIKMLAERGYAFTTTAEREIVANIKEKLCYVSLDFNQELQTNQSTSEIDRSYELPDGQVITIGNERFRCAEPIFQPAHIGFSAYGLQYLIHSSIMKCDISLRHYLYNNIIVSGGNSLFPKFGERIKKELTAIASTGMGINVISPKRKYSTWIGGSVLASMAGFYKICILLPEYDEYGPSIVHRRYML